MSTNTTGVRREVRNGRSILIVDFSYVDPDGRRARYRRDAKIQTASGARVEARRLMELAIAGKLDADERACPTFRAFVAETFEPLYLPQYRPETRVRYHALLHRQGVLQHFGALRLSQIDEMAVRAYATKLQKEGINLKARLNLVRTVVRAAVTAGVLPSMPTWPRLIRASRKVPNAPTSVEVQTMLSTSTGWLRSAIAFGALAGLRMGEVLALEVRDVEAANNRIVVRHALSAGEVVTPKSGHERSVPMVPQLATIASEATRGKFPRARVVVTSTGATPPRQSLLRTFKEHLARVGLPERSFHQLRHYFCSEMGRSGVGAEVVRVLAGHSSLAVTERYMHATEDDLRRAVATLAK